MPEHMRSAAILVLMEGLAQKEAAGILNRPEASVSRYLEMAKEMVEILIANGAEVNTRNEYGILALPPNIGPGLMRGFRKM